MPEAGCAILEDVESRVQLKSRGEVCERGSGRDSRAGRQVRGLGSRLFPGLLVTYSRHISAVPFPCPPILASPRATEEIRSK